MNKPSVKKSPNLAALEPKKPKSSIPAFIATPGIGAAGGGGATTTFRAKSTSAVGAFAIGVVNTFAKDR